MAASKTGQILSKTKAGKIIVDGIADLSEKAGKVLNANLGDVPKVMKQISKEANECALAAKVAAASAAKLKDAAKKGIDKVGKQAAGTVDEAGRKLAGTVDDAGKKAVQNTDTIGKKASESAEDAGKKAPAPTRRPACASSAESAHMGA